MTLDEAIQHAEDKSKEIYIEAMLCHANPDDGNLDECIECAKEHEQLAEWLKDYMEMKLCDVADGTRNVAEVSDEFICEQCGMHIEDYVRAIYDEESEDTTYKGYEFKFCPECGRKVVEE